MQYDPHFMQLLIFCPKQEQQEQEQQQQQQSDPKDLGSKFPRSKKNEPNNGFSTFNLLLKS